MMKVNSISMFHRFILYITNLLKPAALSYPALQTRPKGPCQRQPGLSGELSLTKKKEEYQAVKKFHVTGYSFFDI